MSEVETSRMSLVSRTQFKVLGLEGQVLGLGLEACKSSKMPCPRLVDSTIFWFVENGPRSWRLFFRVKTRQRPCGKFLKNFFSCFFWENAWILRKICDFLSWVIFWRTPEFRGKFTIFLAKTFFFSFGEHLRVVSLALASSIPVLERSVLGLGFFLCPWPQALCPRLHLCKICLIWIHFRKEEIYNIRLSFFKIPCK